MWRFLVLASCCVLAVTGCGGQAGKGADARPEDALDVYEAVFRHHLQKRPAEGKVFLAVDYKDPQAELVERLRKDWPNVAPLSEEPKEKGFRLSASDLEWEGRDKVKVHAGHWYPTKFAGEGRYADYHLVRTHGKWVVNKVTNEIVS